MKSVNLTKLPKLCNSDKINWKKAIGYNIEFIYDDIKDNVEILDYNPKNRKLTLYNSQYGTGTISTQAFIQGQLGFYLKVRNMDYKYSKGDIVNGLEIIEPITIFADTNRKGYKYRCTKDGYVGEILEKRLDNGAMCPICTNRAIVKGINDIATTHPYLHKYFKIPDEAYEYSYGSETILTFKCPDCGYEKDMNVWCLTKRGFSCNQCGDGISIPNKLMFAILRELGIDFIPEYSANWSKTYRYDFYFELNHLKYIIEMDGQHHYIDTNVSDKDDVVDNDMIKEFLARNNHCKIIRINCNYASNDNIFDYLKINIINSDLYNIIDLSNINWTRCFESSLSSLIPEVWKLWNNGIHSPSMIGRTLNINEDTVRKYLKIGKELNKCDYNSDEAISYGQKYNVGNKLPVICLNNSMAFKSLKYAQTELNKILDIHISNRGISDVCIGKKDSYKGYFFKYIKDISEEERIKYNVYEQLKKQEIDIKNLDFYKKQGGEF